MLLLDPIVLVSLTYGASLVDLLSIYSSCELMLTLEQLLPALWINFLSSFLLERCLCTSIVLRVIWACGAFNMMLLALLLSRNLLGF